MSEDDRHNIKVSTEHFEQLKAEKPSGVSWGYYLTRMRTLDPAHREPVESEAEQ